MHIQSGVVYADNQTPEIKVCGVRPLPGRRLWLRFSNGESKIFDFTDLLSQEVFRPLKDDSVFNDVRIDYGTVVWNNGEIDIAPEYLYEYGKDEV